MTDICHKIFNTGFNLKRHAISEHEDHYDMHYYKDHALLNFNKNLDSKVTAKNLPHWLKLGEQKDDGSFHKPQQYIVVKCNQRDFYFCQTESDEHPFTVISLKHNHRKRSRPSRTIIDCSVKDRFSQPLSKKKR